ncbi:hypothetical protein AB6A40_006197 [Gnathostoma spinigerum]|uniref:Uncharacterized protein n=1 Tax=Gnathostoma spinigerum TaxID=75299 RepID=A0ABD6EHV6_9BILA
MIPHLTVFRATGVFTKVSIFYSKRRFSTARRQHFPSLGKDKREFSPSSALPLFVHERMMLTKSMGTIVVQFCLSLIQTVLYFQLIYIRRAVATDTSCIELFCSRTALLHSTTLKCDTCADCGESTLNLCVLNDDECRCVRDLSRHCSSWPEHERYVKHKVCETLSELTHISLPHVNVQRDGSLFVEIDPFWKDSKHNVHYANLTLHAVYAVNNLTDCKNYTNFATSTLLADSICYSVYRVLMPSVDYVADNAYYYDDHQNPIIQFSGTIFNKSYPLNLWCEAIAETNYNLSTASIAKFTAYATSKNITKFWTQAEGARLIMPTVSNDNYQMTERLVTQRSVRLSEQSDQNFDPELSENHRINSTVKEDHSNSKDIAYGLLAQYFYHMVLGGLIFLLICSVICGTTMWCCCPKDRPKKKFSMMTTRTNLSSSQTSREAIGEPAEIEITM